MPGAEDHRWGSQACCQGQDLDAHGHEVPLQGVTAPQTPGLPHHACGGQTPTTSHVHVDVSAPKSLSYEPDLRRAQKVSSNGKSYK